MSRFILLGLLLANCAADVPTSTECRRSDDCDAALCVGGRCRPFDANDGGPVLVDADDTATPEADTIAATGPCAHTLPPTVDTLIVNELLANVPPGELGDANGDGVRDPYDDEFVELVNVAGHPLGLAGVRISSGGKLKHAFESLCVLPGDSVVVFGGGSVGLGVPGNAMISETRFAFANDGGAVEVAMPDGTVTRLEYGRGAATSLTRVPQLSGPQWVEHLELSALPFSPGACPDGSPLMAGCVAGPVARSPDAGSD